MAKFKKIARGFYAVSKDGKDGFIVHRTDIGWVEYIFDEGRVPRRMRTYQTLRAAKEAWS